MGAQVTRALRRAGRLGARRGSAVLAHGAHAAWHDAALPNAARPPRTFSDRSSIPELLLYLSVRGNRNMEHARHIHGIGCHGDGFGGDLAHFAFLLPWGFFPDVVVAVGRSR